jgi:hypothetical protein
MWQVLSTQVLSTLNRRVDLFTLSVSLGCSIETQLSQPGPQSIEASLNRAIFAQIREIVRRNRALRMLYSRDKGGGFVPYRMLGLNDFDEIPLR